MTGTRVIVIAGGSGSGKSHLASRLEESLAPGATILTLDHFYHDLGHLPPDKREQNNFDAPEAIDWPAIEAVLARLTSGQSTEIPHYDFASHTRSPETDRLEPAPFLILEGLWPLTRPAIREAAALSIFVDCDAAQRLTRRIARDTVERGRSEDSVRRQFIQQVEPMHRLHVQPQAALADLVLAPGFGDGKISDILHHPALVTS